MQRSGLVLIVKYFALIAMTVFVVAPDADIRVFALQDFFNIPAERFHLVRAAAIGLSKVKIKAGLKRQLGWKERMGMWPNFLQPVFNFRRVWVCWQAFA